MEHSVMVVAEGPTCVFQKSSAMNLKNGSTTDKRKSIRSSRAPSSRPTLSHTRRKLVSEDATAPYQCTLRRHTLDVIVHDIIKVMMTSLQASKYTKFDHWYHSLIKTIEDLNLLYGEITW